MDKPLLLIFSTGRSNQFTKEISTSLGAKNLNILVINPFKKNILGISETGDVHWQYKGSRHQPALILNLLANNDIENTLKRLNDKDGPFAYSQWLAYLPSLLLGFNVPVINRPILNSLTPLPMNGLITRNKLRLKGFSTPDEMVISNRKILKESVTDKEFYFKSADGVLQKTVLPDTSLADIPLEFPLFIYKKTRSAPKGYFVFLQLVYDENYQPVTQKKLSTFLNHLYTNMGLSYGVCYISEEGPQYMIWNILPIIPDEIKNRPAIIQSIAASLSQCMLY